MRIPIDKIQIGERQRTNLGDLSDLDSMAELGILQPIGVREIASGYELIWGRRRLAKATALGWTEIDAINRGKIPELEKQEMELVEDLARKDRTWQERAMAFGKLFYMKKAAKQEIGENWSIRMMTAVTGDSKSTIGYMIQLFDEMKANPDGEIAKSESYFDALKGLFKRAEKEVAVALEEKRRLAIEYECPPEPAVQILDNPGVVPVTNGPLTLEARCALYNEAFKHLQPPNTPLHVIHGTNDRSFAHGHWFVGGGNISDLYGSYQVAYLDRIVTLFPDMSKVVHLFSGSLPFSKSYTRVGLPQDGNEPDVNCDAHELSSKLKFKPDLIYSDCPYSMEDSEHYDNSMIDRRRVVSECGEVLQPGGFLVWMDQALPVFSNEVFQYVGCISYIRSTGNRFRCVCFFQKNIV